MFAGLTLVTPPAAEPVSIADVKAHSRIFTSVDDSLIAGYISSARHKCETTLMRALLPQQWNYALQHWPGRDYRGLQSLGDDPTKYAHIKIPLPPLISVDLLTYTDVAGNVFTMQQGFSNTPVGNYLLDLDHEPGRVSLPFSGIWPTTILLPTSPIHILFTAGWPYLTGNVDIAPDGLVTLNPHSPPLTNEFFDPRITGSWITIDGQSYVVLAYIDNQHILISAPPAGPISGAVYSANCVPMPIRHAILFMVSHFYENRETVITGRGEVAIEIPGTVDDLLAPWRVFEYANES